MTVLTTANAFPGMPFPQHGSGQTNAVQSYLYPGAVQPQLTTVDQYLLLSGNEFGAIPRCTVASGASTTSIPTSALTMAGIAGSGFTLNQFAGRTVLFDGTTTTAGLQAAQSIIRASSVGNPPGFTVDALPATPVSGDTFSVV